MRIGLIAPPWVPVPPDTYGGTELMLDRLARALSEAGHEVVLFTTGDSTCPVERRNVYECSLGLHAGALSVPEAHHVIRAYDALRDCDIIHDHTVVGPLYAERFADHAALATNHGPFNRELNAVYSAVGHRMPVIAISHAQAVAASAGVWLAGVIHHGLDVDQFPVGEGAGGYLMFLGRMAPEKGARRAAVIARAAGRPLVVAAKMQTALERQYFEEEVRPLLGDGIEMLGEISWERKVQLLAQAEALINPIRWAEPFGLVMIEALACGTPVLSFREGAAPEIVEHGVTGYLCAHEEDMVERLRQLDALDRTACRAAAKERFSSGRMAAEHDAVYRELLSGGLSARRR